MSFRAAFIALLFLSACSPATVNRNERHGWVCRAVSDSELAAHGDGHNGSCDGSEACAREYALRECGRYHDDCKVILCRVEDRTADPAQVTWPR